ncbi:MAG: ATP synthase F1 subunit gamma [Actinobacteria bacterium]|nr:MAG: ATP synthase F1 subunit gamma [Actinomycetota bacterium]
MQTQRDVRNRIGSIKNIQKVTRAMELVAAARLRRAEQRIANLRPYAGAIRRMTRQAAEAAGTEAGRLPLMRQHDSEDHVGLLLVTGDRGLAGAFNSQILRAGERAAHELSSESMRVSWYVSGRRGASSLVFRGHELTGSYAGFTDRPAYADARHIADDLMTAYIDDQIDRVDIIYNHYISPLTQRVTREVLLPLQEAAVLEGDDKDADGEGGGDRDGETHGAPEHRALVEYEPGPEEILRRLIPDYVEISIFRALLESTASEHGARMTAMRNASENAGELIEDLTLEMNRARQAEITQEIMEVVAGAESLT